MRMALQMPSAVWKADQEQSFPRLAFTPGSILTKREWSTITHSTLFLCCISRYSAECDIQNVGGV